MKDEQAFLQAMQEHPEDANLRLVFADWLEERGDLRGELIRLLHTLTQSVEVPDRSKFEDRLRSLMASGVQPVGPFFTNTIGMKFAWIPAGTFLMGSPANEEGRSEDEALHRVTLTKGFYLAIHPATQVCWQEVMENNPSPSVLRGDDLPVVNIYWHACNEFLQKLSGRDGHEYRLPTEAEWEFACRAGTTTPFWFGEVISTDLANYDGKYRPYGKSKKGMFRNKTTPLGSFSPNALGLHDMHGNVSEWCADLHEDYPQGDVVDFQGQVCPDFPLVSRVVRGGSNLDHGLFLRSAQRSWSTLTHNFVGFRVAMTFTP